MPLHHDTHNNGLPCHQPIFPGVILNEIKALYNLKKTWATNYQGNYLL